MYKSKDEKFRSPLTSQFRTGTISLNLEIITTIAASCIETFPKECLGKLLGTRNNSFLTVNSAFPYQLAIRTPNYVRSYGKNGTNNVDTYYCAFLGNSLIGDYHSHTYLEREKIELGLSEFDKKDMRDADVKYTSKKYPFISLVAAIKRTRRINMKPLFKEIEDNIYVRIGAYELYLTGLQLNKRTDDPFQVKLILRTLK